MAPVDGDDSRTVVQADGILNLSPWCFEKEMPGIAQCLSRTTGGATPDNAKFCYAADLPREGQQLAYMKTIRTTHLSHEKVP